MKHVVVVGGGPRAVSVLERLAANLPGTDVALTVHVVDPHPPGGGRVWRTDQSELLRLNSMAEDVTLYLDDTVRCEGPVVPGPTMAELLGGDPMAFPTRHEGGAYLAHVYDRAVAALPSVVVHEATAVDIDPARGVVLDDGSTVPADVVLLAIGHLDAEPSGVHGSLAAGASRAGLTYVPPGYHADLDLSALAPGEDVIVRGLGLAFIDVMVLVAEGRGGRFEEVDGTGRLRYVPSGAEPVLHVGSRRGVPYLCKPTYRLPVPMPPLPRAFTKEAIDALPERADFRRDVWPLLRLDLEWAYEQAMGPARAAAHPLDLDRLDRPLQGERFASADDLQQRVRSWVRADVDRRADPAFCGDLAVYNAWLASFGLLPRALAKVTARSFVEDFDDWSFGFFSYFCSGPPPRRLEELLALSEAGVVRFVGADQWLDVDESAGVFRTGSSSHDDVVTARTAIDATLPKASVRHSRSPLVRALYERGAVEEVVLRDVDGSLHPTGQIKVDPRDGRISDRLFALGFNTSSKAPIFARPNTNAPALRASDACARSILKELACPSSSSAWEQRTTARRPTAAAAAASTPTTPSGSPGPTRSQAGTGS